MHNNYENTAIMNENKKDFIWSTKDVVMFGMWLVNKGEYGYGLLCIHGACLGIKVGSLLKLTWYDFINDNGERFPDEEDNFPSRDELIIKNERKDEERTIILSPFIQRYTRQVYASEINISDVDAPIYINTKTRKVLTTSSLNRELNKLYEQFRLEIYSKTYLDLKFREIKTNTFEIAWGRDMITKYNCTKKVFIAVSKYMGHRSVNDTIKLLELEPNEEITFSYDMFNPEPQMEDELNEIFNSKANLGLYILKNNIGIITDELRIRAEKSDINSIREVAFWEKP